MKKSRFSDDQMVRILREADAEPVATVAKHHEVSEQTIYNGRKHYNWVRPHSCLGYLTPKKFINNGAVLQ